MPKSAPSPKLCIRPVKKIADLSSTTCNDETSEIDMPTPVSNANSLSRMETETDILSVPLSANDTSTDFVSTSAPPVVRSTNCAVDEVNWSSEAAAAELLKLALPHLNTDRYKSETETRQSPSRLSVFDAKDKETKETQQKKRKRNKPTPSQKRLSSSAFPSHSNTTPHSGHDDVNGFLRYLADALSNMSSHVDQSFAKLREDLAFRLNEFETRYVDRILTLESEIEKLKHPDTYLKETHDPIIPPESNHCDKEPTSKTTPQHKLSTTHLRPGYFDNSNHQHLNEQNTERVASFGNHDYPEAVTVAAEVLSELKTGSLSAQTLSTSEAYRPPLPQLQPLERPTIPIDATTTTVHATDRRQTSYEPPVEPNQRSNLYSTSSLPALERQEYKYEYNYSSSSHPDSQSYHYNLPPLTERYKSNFSFTSPSPPPASTSNYYSSQYNREHFQPSTSTSFYPSSTLNSSSPRYNSYPDPPTLHHPRESSPPTKQSTYTYNNNYDSQYNYTFNNDHHHSYPRSNDYPYPEHSDHNDQYYNHNDSYRDEYKRYKPYSYSPNERHRNEGTNNGLNRSIPHLKLNATSHRDHGFPYREGTVPV